MLVRAAALVLLASAAYGQDPARMDQIVQSYVAGRQFMGSVLVARGPDILLNKGYGSANLEWDIPNSPSTKFRLGSLTKQFTAASILLLEQRGKLSVQDPVKKYLPDAPAAWDQITIYNLLTHTSGIPNFTSFPDYEKLEPFSTTPEQLVARFRDKPLDFPPGEKWSYSNSGYVLLGYLIEKITGGSYESFVRDNIFIPLQMKDSGYDSNATVLSHRASGYSPGPHGYENAGFINMQVPHAAGAIYSTTEDLFRWENGLFGGKVLSPESLQKMTTPFKSDYAFGLIVTTVEGHKVIRHAGGIEGFNTFLAYYPEDKLTIVVLSNVNGSAPDEIAEKLAAVAHGQTVKLSTERKEISVDPQVLASYVGTYKFAPGTNMLVTLDHAQLSVKLGGQPTLPVFPESSTSFFLKVVDAQIEFKRDSSGAVKGLILHQGGHDQLAPRAGGDVEQPPARKAVQIAPQILAAYAGVYELQPGVDVTMTVEDGQLMTQITGQPKFPLFAESDTKFFLKVVDAQVEFVKNSSGRVESMILHQGGRDTKANRK